MSVARGGIVRCVVGALAAAGAAAGGIVAAPGPAVARPAHVRIAVDAPVASAYRAVHVRVTGLPPGDQITITSSAHDHAGMLWEARASFTADPSGTVDLTRQAPTSGTYRGADGMGLVWSMDPVASSGASESFYFAPPHPEVQSDFPIALSVRDASGHLASATLTRVWMEPGVTHRTFTVAADGVYGDLYLPAPSPGATPRPAVLLFGGSEGGEAERYTAAVLASAGYPALSIAYFDAPGLPGTLTNIPLEYFAGAARILAEQPQVDPAHVLAMGASRGTEAALLLAQYFPDLIHGAIVYAPSSKVNPSFPSGTGTAWTLHGAGLAIGTRIPLDNVSGPVLAIAGTDDAVWDSSLSAHLINTDLNTDGLAYPHEVFIYPLAGHGIDEGVYVPSSLSYTDPASGYTVEFGGTREADAAGQQAAWQKVLALLAWLRRH
jgi:dienelactone hydrolase